MIGNILIARILTPSQLGSFSYYLLIVNYVILIQIGVPSGLSRQFPYYIGSENKLTAEKIASTAKYFSFYASVVVLVITLLLSIYALFVNQLFEAMGYFVVGVSVIQTLYITKYLKLLYRSNMDFSQLAKIEIILASVNFMGIYLIYKFGIWGMGLRLFLVFLIDVYFSHKWVPIKINKMWDKTIFIELLRIGSPIFFVSSIFSIWPIVQRTFIFEKLGEHALGLFSLAVAVQTAMSIITTSSSSIVYPRISNMFGEKKPIKEIFLFCLKIDLFVLIVNFILAIIGYFSIPFLVMKFLPNYNTVIPVCQLFLVYGVIASFTTFSNLYQLLRKNNFRLISFVLGILTWLIYVIYAQNANEFDLTQFPVAMIISQIIMYLFDLLYFFCFVFPKNEKVSTL